jgi:hypothetical protein
MIHIKTYSLLQNFERRTYEFHDNYFTVKIKSLSFEVEEKIDYKEIREIQIRKFAELGWFCTALYFFVAITLIDLGLDLFSLNSSTFQSIEKALIIVGTFFYLSTFRKKEWCSLFDQDQNLLINIRINHNNRNEINEIVNLIKQKVEEVKEIKPSEPFPTIAPTFEIVQYDIPNFIKKSTARFYKDFLINVEKSLVKEDVYIVKYSELSGKIKVIKAGNTNWDTVWSYWLLFVCAGSISISIFFPNIMNIDLPYLYLLLGGFALLIPIYFLRFIKSEVVMFYNVNDDVVFVLRRFPPNEKIINQIMEFIEFKVAQY